MLNYNMPPSITSLDEPIYAGCSLIIQELICCRPPSDFFPLLTYLACSGVDSARTMLSFIILVPYSRTAGPPYCSPPAQGVCKPTGGKSAARYQQRAATVDETAQTTPTVSPFDPAVRDDAITPLRFGRCLHRSMVLGSRSYL